MSTYTIIRKDDYGSTQCGVAESLNDGKEYITELAREWFDAADRPDRLDAVMMSHTADNTITSIIERRNMKVIVSWMLVEDHSDDNQ